MATHKALSKEDILSAEDLPIQEHYVPDWGGNVWLRTLTGTERDRFESQIAQVKGTRGLRANFVIAIACDGSGKPLFVQAEYDALEKKSAAALHGIMEAGLKHNRMTEDDIEDAEGNSVSGPDSETGTD